jgi:hypothetical protein
MIALVALGSTVAGAAWTPGGSGSGRSTGLAIGLPTSVTATATGSTSVQVSWSPPGGASASPTQYVVRRTAPSSATVCTVGAPTTTCNDTGLTASTTYSYTVEARVGTSWSSGQTTAVSATTSGAPTFIVTTSAGNKTAGTAFTVTVTATTDGTTTDTSYFGFKSIDFTGPSQAPSGASPTYPNFVFFWFGVGTANVTLVDAESATLSASDGTISGSAPVTVVAGAASQLRFTSSTPSCASGSVIVGNGGTFTTKVTAYDAYLNPKTGARTVTLTRTPSGSGSWTPTSLTIPAAGSETTASSNFKIPNGNPPNATVTAASTGLTSTTCVVKKN